MIERETIIKQLRAQINLKGHIIGAVVGAGMIARYAAYVIKQVPEIDGFFGASSIERLASERGMTAQAAAFKAIEK